MRLHRSSHGSPYVSLIMGGVLGLVLCFATGCAQRAHINPTHGTSYKSIFYQQASTPAVQLAPTTSEDAKRISKSRANRSGNNSGRGRGIGFGAGSNSSVVGN